MKGNRRRKARELALQGLYQWQLSGANAAVVARDLRDAPDFAAADADYLDDLVGGTIGHAAALDAHLAPCMSREASTLSPVEHAALLIGAYELAHHPEVPYRVVINEAIELAKLFGGSDGHRFVNGALDRLATVLRPAEAGVAKT